MNVEWDKKRVSKWNDAIKVESMSGMRQLEFNKVVKVE